MSDLDKAILEAVTEMRLASGALQGVSQHARAAALLRYAENLERADREQKRQFDALATAIERMPLSETGE